MKAMTTKELTEKVENLKGVILTLCEENNKLREDLLTLSEELNTITNRVDTLATHRVQTTASRVATTNGGRVNQNPQRPPSEGGWVKPIGKPGERVDCPEHGSIVLNKFGCCYHCFNAAHKARSIYKANIKQQEQLALPIEA